MATITCQDCAAERRQTPKNTRYCKPCRLLRDIGYWIGRFRACRDCGARFSPIHRTDYRCSACDPGIRGRAVDCALCKTTGVTLLTGIPVCSACLRDPKRRNGLVEALERGQKRRKEQNHA